MKYVLADLHHFDLYYSLHLLCKRMGWTLVRPIGQEWKQEGYWNLSTEPIVIDGYLSRNTREFCKHIRSYEEFTDPAWARYGLELLRLGPQASIVTTVPGLVSIGDQSKFHRYQYGITLNGFKYLANNNFVVAIISSVPHHFPIFEKLRLEVCPHVSHIHHCGNIGHSIPSGVNNLLTNIPRIELDVPNLCCGYHQEFDTSVFSYSAYRQNSIYSYVHFPEGERLRTQIWQLINLPFKYIGKTLGLVKDMIVDSRELAKRIQESAFTWHIKPCGEGFGHILHNSFACGTPVITNFKDYKGFIGMDLLEDGVTAIDVDRHTDKEIASMIMDEVSSGKMRSQVYQRFLDKVDFDKEFNSLLRPFLESLV